MPVISFSQQNSYEFLKFEESENDKTVYFGIAGITSEVHKKEIWNRFMSEPDVKKILIYDDNNCKLTINKCVTADYVHEILISFDVDFKYEVVKLVNDHKKDAEKEFPDNTSKKLYFKKSEKN